MNRSDHHRWRSLTPNDDVRWLKYSFGPGSANSLAVRLDDGGWLVVSPAANAPDSVVDELARDGGVTALLAPNAYHHTGQSAWRRRFPSATSYAASAALPRLHRKSPGIDYHPLEELVAMLPRRIQLVVPDGLKQPDVLLRIESGAGRVWWLGELFSNTSSGDQIFLLRLLARLAGSGLGYRRNTRPGLVYVADEKAWLASLRRMLEAHPPAIVVPAHGDPVDENVAARTQALVAL
ncbi:MAG: hypothetical protein ACOY0T_37215 [Myxococcota bacterium]